MKRSLIELTRNALGKDFLAKRIEREIIENVAKDLLPLQEKVKNDLLERVVYELCKEQDKILEKRAIKGLKSIIDMSWEDEDIYELAEKLDDVWEEGSDVYLEKKDIKDVDKLSGLIGDFEELMECMTIRWSELHQAYEDNEDGDVLDDIITDRIRVEGVLENLNGIITTLSLRQSEIEDGQE